jgi:hypothetical protein
MEYKMKKPLEDNKVNKVNIPNVRKDPNLNSMKMKQNFNVKSAKNFTGKSRGR